AVVEPALGRPDQIDVLPLESDFLAKLTVHGGLRALVRSDAPLRELPAAAAAPSRDKHTPCPVGQNNADVRSEALFVYEIHGPRRRPIPRDTPKPVTHVTS